MADGSKTARGIPIQELGPYDGPVPPNRRKVVGAVDEAGRGLR